MVGIRSCSSFAARLFTAEDAEDAGNNSRVAHFPAAKDAEGHAVVPINDITETIIKCAMTVHSAVGPGLLEKAYDACFYSELSKTGLQFEHQLKVPLLYRGVRLKTAFQVDYFVENRVLLELKSVEKLHPVHSAQIISYLKLTGVTVGLLVNFNVVHLRDGIRRLVNGYVPDPPASPSASSAVDPDVR
jgi:GxxExxY protein